MPFELTPAEIRNCCNARFYQRGVGYKQTGRVLIAEWDEDSQFLYGEVEGSGSRIYEQEIYFSRAGRKRIDGLCSCPVGRNCKHVAAVLLQWLEWNAFTKKEHIGRNQSKLLPWQQDTVERLERAAQSHYTEPGQACLLHLLRPDRKGHIEVDTVKSRLLKRGGWGKCSHFDLSGLTGYNYYYGSTQGAMPLDVEIAQLFEQRGAHRYSSNLLQGDVGQLILLRLLASGRCFFQSPDNPALTVGSTYTATFDWQTIQQKTQLKIALEDGPDRWLLIPTSPPWYLDTQNHQCGRIEQPLSAEMLHSLTLLPEVETEDLAELSSFLLQKLPPESMPLPVELKVNRIDEPPVPHLRLFSVSGPQGARHHLVRLRFHYGPLSMIPYTLTGNASEWLHYDDMEWQIERRIPDELRAEQSLNEFSLIPAHRVLETAGEFDLQFDVDSLAASALAWKRFLAEVPRLEAGGWRIEIDPNFVLSFETVETLSSEIDSSDNSWFEIGLNIEHDGHKIPMLPLLLQWFEEHEGKSEQPLLHHLEGNRWLEIPSSVLKPVVSALIEIFQEPQLDQLGRFKLPRFRAHNLLEVEKQLEESGHQLDRRGGQEVRLLAEKLRDFKGLEPVAVPESLNAKLRGYQQQGVAWLQFLRQYCFNGVLADDMGLGKTIQTLTHLLVEKEAGRLDQPALIVAPTSVLSNWQRETARFAPGLSCRVLHGAQRTDHFADIPNQDLIVTSYALLSRDLEQHQQHSYHSLILDEAQAIKNPRTRSAQAAGAIKAQHRLCLTGTPLENHLGELWSLFHFLMPGMLGSQKMFNRLFRTPIERHDNRDRQAQLQQRIVPFVLRRTKDQVACELPPKTVMIREAQLGDAQAKLYESLRLAMSKKINLVLERKGLQNSHIDILDALLKLRQACCDPRLVKLESARKVKQSAKLEELLELLAKLLDEDRKILIFSQFTSMLSLIENELVAHGIRYSKLTGQTRKRDEAISAFQDGDASVFLISLKAGGVGLNLTAADTVIHYDPWWNPAVENQATDRAHRIGQQKPVFVYRLVARGTVEEKILQMQDKKQRLADGIYKKDQEQEPLARVSAEDLLQLLAPIDQKTD